MTETPFDLEGRIALVVGGRGYVGREVCSALSNAGAIVVAADIQDRSKAAAGAGSADDTRIEQKIVDVTVATSIDALVEDMIRTHGGIDALVYAVTTKPDDFYKPFTDCSLEGWQAILRTELDGAFLVTQRVGAAMEPRGGSIVLLGSIYGVVGNDQRLYEGSNLADAYGAGGAAGRIYAHAAYATAKGGIIALTRFLAAYWGDRGIRVNCVSPGGVAHPAENDAFVKRYSERVPLGRKAAPGDVASAIVYLSSDAARYVTGHNLLVDGGWTTW